MQSMKKPENTPPKNVSSQKLVNEILNKDRLLYLEIIRDKKSLTSLQMTREILALEGNVKPEQIEDKKVVGNNPNINARLKGLADYGVLNDHNGEYSLSSIGLLLIDELPRLILNLETLEKYKNFFDVHDYTVIPPQQFRDIYKLQHGKQCKDAIDYSNILLDNTGKAENKLRIVTDRLHTIPNWIMQEIKQENIAFELIYQFKELFKPNFNDTDEMNLWRDLIEIDLPGVKLRYLTFGDRNPIGIHIIDEKWAMFNLFEIAETILDRPKSFYGTDEQFVHWVAAMFSSMWDESKPLDVKNIEINSVE